MLTKRTNLLLTEPDYLTLKRLSKKQNKTMGELIRKAIRQVYLTQDRVNQDAEKTLAKIRRLTKNINTKNLNFRELIEYGRRY